MVLSLMSSMLFSDSCNCLQGINSYQPHSFNAYSSRDILHKKTFYTNDSHRDEWQGMFSVVPEYMRSFNQNCGECSGLGSRPFWSGTNSMTYGINDGNSNVDAYQFGMGDVKGQGTITINPRVEHYGADMMLHFARNKFERGLFFTIKAPLAALSIETNITEDVAVPISDSITFTDNSDNTIVTDISDVWPTYPAQGARYKSLREAWQAGSATAEAEVSSSRHNLLVITQGRLSDCKQTAIRMADVSMTLGYKLYASDKGFVDFGFKVTCPTGNVPKGEFIFEPIVGRAGHWGVGAELSSRYEIWNNQTDQHLDFWMQGEVVHLFSGRTGFRSFDLKKNGKGSKYMLLQHYFPVTPTDDNPTGRLASFVTHAVNVTTMPVKSSFSAEGSLAAAFDYHKDNWNMMLGAEFWGRACEKLELDCCKLVKYRVANLNEYAVLGRQASEDARSFANNQAILDLHLCEPEATISKSENIVLGEGVPPAVLTYPTNLPEGVKDARVAANRIPSSLHDALDVCGAAEGRALTGRLLGELGYTFKDCHYTPHLGLFGSVEVNNTTNTTVRLWSVGAQGSLNF
tara:strand:- start:2221 stop:3939 length:1719 start_codon:yes stop_codon:yes gene_type:complete